MAGSGLVSLVRSLTGKTLCERHRPPAAEISFGKTPENLNHCVKWGVIFLLKQDEKKTAGTKENCSCTT